MDAHFSGSMLAAPPGLERSNVIISNEGTSMPVDPIWWKVDRWCPLVQYIDCDGRYFLAEGEKSEFRVRLVHAHLAGGPGGDFVDLRCERFLLGVGFDTVTKQQVEVRRRVIGHSPSGEPIFPVFNIPACEFVSKFRPDSWMTASEWASAKAELRPLIEEELAILMACRTINEETAQRRMEASAAAQNPQAYMASAIAAGIATAIKEMNLAPRKTKD
jgi:hypothetical protein